MSNCRRKANCPGGWASGCSRRWSAIRASSPRRFRLRIYPPLFNRYRVGHHFGVHVDNAVRGDPATGLRIRADLAVTVFLSEPDEYDGGELIVDDAYDSHGQASGRLDRRLSRRATCTW